MPRKHKNLDEFISVPVTKDQKQAIKKIAESGQERRTLASIVRELIAEALAAREAKPATN